LPQEEQTNNRPKAYSKWHRDMLPSWCYQTDGDFFEQRLIDGVLQTVAYIETIQIEKPWERYDQYPLWSSKESLITDIAARGWKSYVVYHNKSCSEFTVVKWRPRGIRKFNVDEYIRWVKSL
jgi:hypothetical protein